MSKLTVTVENQETGRGMSACVVTFLKITTPMGGVIELTNVSVQGAMDLLNAINRGLNDETETVCTYMEGRGET